MLKKTKILPSPKRPVILSFYVVAILATSFMFTNLSPVATLDPVKKAHRIFRRLTGTVIPLDDKRIVDMAALLTSGKDIEAAAIATENTNFYDITLREFAARMSTRDLNVNAPLSDYIATVVGAVRDDRSAQTLLTGNYFYKGDATVVGTLPAGSMSRQDNDKTGSDSNTSPTTLPDDILNDIVLSNRHYDALAFSTVSMKDSLIAIEGQKLADGKGQLMAHPDPAGLITSRSYMQAHAVAGTNRRLVEFMFATFMCTPLVEAADNSAPDAFVGPDVTRFPSGTNTVFQQTCKGCHAGMDAMRPAFAHITFEAGRTKWVPSYRASTVDTDADPDDVKVDPSLPGISAKYTRNGNNYPNGFLPNPQQNTTAWVNYFNFAKGQKLFGWRGAATGSTLNDLAKSFAASEGFSRCMAKRVFQSVCKRELAVTEGYILDDMSKSFEKDSYNLKHLFQSAVVRSECTGE